MEDPHLVRIRRIFPLITSQNLLKSFLIGVFHGIFHDFPTFLGIFHGICPYFHLVAQEAQVLTELRGHAQGLGIHVRHVRQHPQHMAPLGAAEGTQGAGGDQERIRACGDWEILGWRRNISY